MEKKTLEVFYKPVAERQITAIAIYIEQKGFPDTAEKFACKLYDFGDGIGIIPEGFPTCRNKIFAKRNFRCAVFQKDYIFVYKVFKSKITIYLVIHASRIR